MSTAQQECPACHGAGRVEELNRIHVRAHGKGPGYEVLSVHCEACAGTGAAPDGDRDKLQAVHKAWAALDAWWRRWLDTQRYSPEVERAEWAEWHDMRKAMHAASRADGSDLRALLDVASASIKKGPRDA